jgi:hypothetical protein
LFVTRATVAKHLQHLYEKLDVRTRTEAATRALDACAALDSSFELNAFLSSELARQFPHPSTRSTIQPCELLGLTPREFRLAAG